MSKLIENHLSILDKVSSHFGVEVFLPYGDENVMNSANRFNINELINEHKIKKPIYDIGEKNQLPKEILERRKYGLVSALNKFS